MRDGLIKDIHDNDILKIKVDELPKDLNLPSEKSIKKMSSVLKDINISRNVEMHHFVTASLDPYVESLKSSINAVVKDPSNKESLDTLRKIVNDVDKTDSLGAFYHEIKESHPDLPSIDDINNLRRGFDLIHGTQNELSLAVGKDLIKDAIEQIKSHDTIPVPNIPSNGPIGDKEGVGNVRYFVETLNEFKKHPENSHLLERLRCMVDLKLMDDSRNDYSFPHDDIPNAAKLEEMKEFVNSLWAVEAGDIYQYDVSKQDAEIKNMLQNIEQIKDNPSDKDALVSLKGFVEGIANMEDIEDHHHDYKDAYPSLPSMDDFENLKAALRLSVSESELSKTVGDKMLADTIDHIESSADKPDPEHVVPKSDDVPLVNNIPKRKF